MKLFVVFGLFMACAAVATGHGHGGHGGDGGSSYANSNSVAHSSGGHGGGHDESHDYYAHPEYKYEYGVEDHHTGDKKSQWEHRDGDVVKGGYTVAEPDGTKLVVEYTSDKHNGYNAVVKRIGHASHPAVYGHGGGDGGHGGAGGHGESGGQGGSGGHGASSGHGASGGHGGAGGSGGHGGAGGHGLSHGYFH